jgi:hypothetical protein
MANSVARLNNSDRYCKNLLFPTPKWKHHDRPVPRIMRLPAELPSAAAGWAFG